MPERNRWGPRRYDVALINLHLDRQKGIPDHLVKLDNGEIVRVGHDAEGEGDDCDERE